MPLSTKTSAANTSNKSLRIFTLVGLLFLLFHFLLTFVYCFPEKPVAESLRQSSNEYMVPFFHQGWQLFAPDVPLYHGRVYFKTMPASFDTAWVPFGSNKAVSEHWKLNYAANRLSLMLMADMKKDLYFSGDTMKYDLVQNGRGYLSFVYFAGELQRAKTGSRPDSIQIKLDVIYPETPEGAPLNENLSYIFPWFELK
ncbi:MAG: hypothetical protein O2984_03875 [Bacteroidetes bacterium]|nr:hypothetical protein [Bacteroidota bacterium]